MEVFETFNFKVNHSYLRLLGMWPHDDISTKKTKRIIIISLTISLIIPQVIRLVEEWGKDFDIVIEVIGSVIYFLGCQLKYISFLRVELKMKTLYEEIARNWKRLSNVNEQDILQRWAGVGRFMTLGYIIPINIILVVYISLPLTPILLDMIDPLNESRPRAFPYFAEYFIDDQKYYFQLTIHGWIVCILSVQIYGTFDTNYVQCAQHACALFSIAEYRIRRAAQETMSDKYSNDKEKNEAAYNEMVKAIILHKEALQFVNLIEECYSSVFFGTVSMNTAVVSLAAVVTMLNLEEGNYKQTIRMGMLYIGFSFHLLYNMISGQNVMDSSTHVRETAFHSGWYNTSKKTKKLLQIVMLRSMIPSTFTGGKLITLNFESFAFVFKKSVSYVTMIGSMR